MDVINAYHEDVSESRDAFWIFTLFQWFGFILAMLIIKGIPDVPKEVEIQLKRTEFITSKLIELFPSDGSLDNHLDNELPNEGSGGFNKQSESYMFTAKRATGGAGSVMSEGGFSGENTTTTRKRNDSSSNGSLSKLSPPSIDVGEDVCRNFTSHEYASETTPLL